jgi:cell division septation protein DedD
MNDHNLDDLIIDNIKPKSGKAKSLLTIFALLIVVLIVAIILTKVILKDPNETNISSEENNTEMISPELRLQNVTKKQEEAKEESKLSSIIEKELSEPVKAPEVKEIVETAEPVQVQKTEVEEPKAEIEEPKAEVTKPANLEIQEAKEEVAAPQSVEITKEFTQSPEVPEVEPETKESEKAEEVAVHKTKPTPAKKKKPKTVTSASGHPYYIQVGSFSKTPSSRFLNVIKSSGFHYKITSAGKTKKLLIGPYKDRASANTALVRVKDRINKSAFVVKK